MQWISFENYYEQLSELFDFVNWFECWDHSYRWFKIIKKVFLKIIDHHHWIYSNVQFSKYILITSTTVQIYLPRNFPHFKYISIFFLLYYISVLLIFNSLTLTIIAFHHVFSPLNEEDQEEFLFFLFLSSLPQYWRNRVSES